MFAIVIRSLNALLMIAMPLVLGVYLYRKLGSEWRIFGIGAMTFVVSQVFHIPFNAGLLAPWMALLGLDPDVSIHLAIIAFLLGLSAGLFEEIARYIVYKFYIKEARNRTWGNGLMFGAGHGGIEAIILGVLVVYGFVRLFALKDANLEVLIPADQLEVVRAQVELYWSAPWYATILGAMERAATLCFHMSATLIVLQAFRRKNILWLFFAILWHTVVDAIAVFASQTWSIYLTEALIVGAGILALGIIFAFREAPNGSEEEKPIQIDETRNEIETHEPSIDQLEDSRYA
jgi:uncharacterized membrane protein YhfC